MTCQKTANTVGTRPACKQSFLIPRTQRRCVRNHSLSEVASIAEVASSGSVQFAVGGGVAIAGLGALLVATDPQNR